MSAKKVITILILSLSVMLWADIVQYYTFSTGTETYVPITGTPISDILTDDAISSTISIGFPFTYGLNVYNDVKVSSNGWVGLGYTGDLNNLSNELTSEEFCPVLAPLWDDDSLLDGNCQYLTSGTAPNRVFTIQYTNMKWNYQGNNTHNMQVKMYESGLVKFCYGASTGTPNNPSASIGINILPGGDNNFWSITPGNPASASTTAENGGVQTFPANGTVYSFNPPLAVPNDMSALSIVGNYTPSVGLSANYTVLLRNFGTAAQSNYTVKLMTGTTELASIAGPALAPLTNTNVTIPWTPTTAGTMAIYAKVFLAGDQNAINDQCSPLTVSVQPAGTIVVTIGNGNQMSQIPMDMSAPNSLFETIYPSTEIGTTGMITGLTFYNNFQTNLTAIPTKIWLGATAQTDLSTGWIPSTQLVQVFDGVVNYPSGSNLIHITLSVPFLLGGTNLVMLVNRPVDANNYDWQDQFLCQTAGTNRSLRYSSWGTPINPASPPSQGATLSGQFPKTSLHLIPGPDDPMFGVAPSQRDFGTILMNNTVSQTFTVFNVGSGNLTISDLVITGSPFYTLQTVPTLPVTLTVGQYFTFSCTYHPTAAGTHAGTIDITDNLARIVHSIPLTGISMDPTIYTPPYTQNWDAITIPDLPLGWQKCMVAAEQGGSINTIDWQSHSPSNAVQISNSDNTNPILLVAPPLATTIPVNGSRIKFWAKGDASEPVQVGIISNPTDAATFQIIQSITLNTVWSEYAVGFQTYTGTGQYIAFKHGNTNPWQSLYIDDIIIEQIPQNDLAAISITGNSTPSVGMATNYTVNLFNWGTLPQSNYTVKLYKEGDVEVASTAGTLINPGLTLQTTVTWTPTTAGATFIYAKVLLTGDQNSLNNQTPNLNVLVQPAGTMVVTLGDGNENGRMPMDMYYRNSMFETVFLASELNFIGMITGISFYNDFVTNLTSMPTKIWLGTTTQSDLTTGWIPSTSLTQMFDGTVDYPSGENVISVTFTNPFLYLEGNLVLMVERPMDTQFYSSEDNFLCQTGTISRTQNVISDLDDFNPETPPAETTAMNQYPKTSFFIIPGGVGHLTGTVRGAGNQVLANATVQIVNGGMATTNATGHYLIQNIIDGTYQVSCSRYGYIAQTVSVNIPEDETVTQDFTLVQMPTVTLTGLIVGSDAPTVGLSGAILSFTGYEDYTVTTDATGHFTLPGVYTNQTYEYIITRAEYQTEFGSVTVGTTNHNMGTISLDEIAYSPRNVTATENVPEEVVDITWIAPDPNAVDITEDFESVDFPPTGWGRIITNNGPPSENGVYPTWCRFGAVMVGNDLITPTDGSWQAGFFYSFSHQDEWLMTPQFNCPQGSVLTFDSNVFYGSSIGEHYYVKVSMDNGNTWTPVWDASALTGGWNHYQTPISISLNQFSGQQITIAWHADDANDTSEGMWYVWFLDNIIISNSELTLRFSEEDLTALSTSSEKVSLAKSVSSGLKKPAIGSTEKITITTPYDLKSQTPSTSLSSRNQRHHERPLVGYKVWRLTSGQEQNEPSWTLLTPEDITTVSFTDTTWSDLPNSTYKWAIKGKYFGGVMSLAVFSNPVVKQPIVNGTLAGIVRNAQNQVMMGAVVNVGTLSAVTASNGSYILQVPAGTHSVNCTAGGYAPQTQNNVVVNAGFTTVLNFNMGNVSNEDEVIATQTMLKNNYPNPFNPETHICFDVKDRAPVRIDIYNIKGQLIRTLVNETKSNGHYRVVWDGKDDKGNGVASGVYNYRMQSGDFKATRRMMLMK